MDLIFTIALCIMVSFIVSKLAQKLRISSMVALVITGIIIGIPEVREIVLEPNISSMSILGDAGLLILMFLAGLEVSWSMMYKERKDAIFVASFGAITSFLIGFAAFMLMGFSLVVSLIVGICMSITAEATRAEVLIELKKLKTKLGSMMMGAGIIDDFMGIFLFLTVIYFLTKGFEVDELLILFSSISAFFIGIFVHKFIGRERHIIPHLEKFLMIFFIPFFFIAMGMHFSLEFIFVNPLLIIIIIIIAIAGKILGAIMTKPFTELKLKQLYLVGWGMNSRGAVGLAIVLIAFKFGLIDTNIYSSLVLMALATTLLFPFFLKRMIKKEPHLMD